MTETLLPELEVQSPEGETFVVKLEKDRITIGRFRAFNDVGLEPDPQQLVTRKAHCAIEHEANAWYVVDNGSVNRTFIKRGSDVEIVNGRTMVNDGDVIRVLGRFTEEGEALYWNLIFRDPMKTQPFGITSNQICLAYDWVQAKLFRLEGPHRYEISNMRPQEHKLIRYMEQRNRANGDVPVMCSYEELTTAIWGDEPDHTEAEVNHLVYELRQKIEVDPKAPCFLQPVRGLGYRLVTIPPL
ncbi:MAG: winged helix-turn-helix domain-containing protein [Anaerolineae bacterium]|nr:winged helix-turn-helix domain-containing protein [Anaerolineae bacterium]